MILSKNKIFFVIIFFFGNCLVTHANTIVLEVVTFEMIPYVMPGGKTGIVIDTLNEIAKRSGIKLNFTIEPLKRGILKTKKLEGNCVAPIDRSHDRETDFKWISPILISQTALFGMGNTEIKIDTLDEAKKYSIGVQSGSIAENKFRSLKFKIVIAEDSSQSIKQMKGQRIDLWAADTLVANYWAKKKEYKIKELLNFETSLAGMACNVSVADKHIQKMNQELFLMYKKGKIKKIFEKYTSDLGIKINAQFLN